MEMMITRVFTQKGQVVSIVFAKPNCLRAAHWHCPGAISFDPLFCR